MIFILGSGRPIERGELTSQAYHERTVGLGFPWSGDDTCDPHNGGPHAFKSLNLISNYSSRGSRLHFGRVIPSSSSGFFYRLYRRTQVLMARLYSKKMPVFTSDKQRGRQQDSLHWPLLLPLQMWQKIQTSESAIEYGL